MSHSNKRRPRVFTGNKVRYEYGFMANIFKFMETDPFYVVERLEEYIDKFERDYNAREIYCSMLLTIGEFDKCEEQLKILETNFPKDKAYEKSLKKGVYEKSQNKILYDRLRLLVNSYKYEEAIDFINKYNTRLQQTVRNTSLVKFYCLSKLKRVSTNRDEQEYYLSKQIVEYRKEDFIERKLRDIEKGFVQFNPEFDVNKIYDECMDHFDTGECLHKGFITDTYQFKYDDCGNVDGNSTDFFSVIVIRGTSKIIDMFPSVEIKGLPYKDLNYIKQTEKPMTRTKRLSQIDKFNQRYGKMYNGENNGKAQ